MIASRYRFHSRGGIKYTHSGGKQVRGDKISLTVVKDTGRKNSRFAVIVSKKVLKSAVGRNRIRRRVYEVIRLEVPKFINQHDVLVSIYSKDIKDITHHELKNTLVGLFKAANLY
jgi:ribonuclease P protein component